MRFQLDMKVLVKDQTSKFKGERWDLVPGEEIKFNDGRGKLLTSLIQKVSIRKETLDEYDVLNWQT